MSRGESQRVNPTPIRLSPDLKRKLQHIATENHRSLSGEIAIRLERSVQQDGKEARQ